jgi:hypothetical protein
VITDAGARLDISGAIRLVIGGDTHSGTLSGKVRVGDADPKDAASPRDTDGEVWLTLEDGTALKLDFRGTAVVSDRGPNRTHELTVRFALEGGAAVGLAESGELTGTFGTRDDTGTLDLTLPGSSS